MKMRVKQIKLCIVFHTLKHTYIVHALTYLNFLNFLKFVIFIFLFYIFNMVFSVTSLCLFKEIISFTIFMCICMFKFNYDIHMYVTNI